ncbi:hypothetical protein JCM19037_4449 [Geomicrobium sp. JCM 19037]|nr:hypothetical protein JCM19037_4449 [Geomicrobium sp. JCM 19037]
MGNMESKHTKDIRIKTTDYQRFAAVFLLVSLFLSVGFLLPESSKGMRSIDGLLLWTATLFGALYCMTCSLKWQNKDE